MVELVQLQNLRISESVQFFDDVLTICKNNNPSDLNIQKPWAALDKSFKRLSQSFKKEQASTLTAELATLDFRRDQGITCLRKLADGYTNHHDDAKKEAGNLLLKTIDNYGNSISRINYQAETSLLENLTTDLKNDTDVAAAAKLLGVSDTITEIKTANDLFNQTYLNRVKESAADDMIAAGELVLECKEKYKVLVKYIEANATINPSEACTTLIGQLNSLIEKFNAMLAQRGKKDNGDGNGPV